MFVTSKTNATIAKKKFAHADIFVGNFCSSSMHILFNLLKSNYELLDYPDRNVHGSG